MSVKTLNMLAKQLRQRRMEAGALTLASPEVRFKLENDSQDPVDVELKELKDTNALVEEFMLLANISVARKIHSHFPDSSMLRRHPSPAQGNFETLKLALSRFGIEIQTTTSKELSDSLDKCIVKDNPYFNKMVRIMTTRCMMQAVYFCSGTLPPADYWHYGLASDIYTHFTSPIRRFADLVVHRLLAACIGYDKVYSADLTDKVKMTEECDILNYRHRNAQQASRSSVELYTHLFFKDKNVTEDAYVTKVLKNGFCVLVPKYGIEAIIHGDKEKTVGEFDVATGVLKALNENGQPEEIYMFKGVKVNLSCVSSGNGQRSSLVCVLKEPRIVGLIQD